jgi:hypothetical protein
MDGVAPYRPDAPKKKRKMVQPTKDYIRAELKLADAEIERLQAEVDRLRAANVPPWWARAWATWVGDAPLPIGSNPPPPPGPKPPPPPCPPPATTLVRDGNVTKFR